MDVDGVFSSAALIAGPPLDLLRAMADGRTPQTPMGRTLGFRLSAIEAGRATFAATPGAAFLNPMGTVHGGWASAVLDSAMGCAVLSTLAAGEMFTTLELKINFTRAIRADGAALEAVGTVMVRGRRVVTAEARMTDRAGCIAAHATSTCLIVPVEG